MRPYAPVIKGFDPHPSFQVIKGFDPHPSLFMTGADQSRRHPPWCRASVAKGLWSLLLAQRVAWGIVTTRRHHFILLGVENSLSLPPMKRASKGCKTQHHNPLSYRMQVLTWSQVLSDTGSICAVLLATLSTSIWGLERERARERKRQKLKYRSFICYPIYVYDDFGGADEGISLTSGFLYT